MTISITGLSLPKSLLSCFERLLDARRVGKGSLHLELEPDLKIVVLPKPE